MLPYTLIIRDLGPVAQMVEQLTFNQLVARSIRAGLTIKNNHLRQFVGGCFRLNTLNFHNTSIVPVILSALCVPLESVQCRVVYSELSAQF